MKEIVVVDKIRKTYLYQDYEIAVDSVKGLGDSVEIEYKGEPGSRQAVDIANDMVRLLKQIGCGKITRDYVGYPFQLLFPDEMVAEEV